jgi:hypothetical protein
VLKRPPGDSDPITETVISSSLHARWALGLGFLALAAALGFSIAMPRAGYVGLACLLAVFLLAFLFVAVGLRRRGPDREPWVPLLAGWIFILGGTGLDIGGTVTHSPNLDREGNAVIRALLDSGQALTYVYAVGAFGEGLASIALCLVWAGFLRHRRTWIASAWSAEPASLGSFIKSATGGGHLTWRQYFLPVKVTELPHAYHLFWTAAPLVLLIGAVRWWCGFEWLGVVPLFPMGTLGLCLLAIVAGMVVLWPVFEWLHTRPGPRAQPPLKSHATKGAHNPKPQ